ncbi:MAG: hypothetical protein ABIT37_19765, partial [Luteolibacter sp.]
MKLQDKQHNTSVLPLVYRPEWVEQATEPCRWDEDGKFWYQNQEDYQCGLSYRQRLDHPVPQEWDSPSQGVTWHEELRATIIDGKAWCSVHDASLLAGVTCPYSSESGQGDQVMVRFKADLVQPDNLRDLFPQGINDYGIRIEALVPIFTKARNGDQLLKWLTGTVIPQLYGNSASQIGEKPPVYVFRMGQPAGPAPVGEVRINSLNGEMRAVVIGSRLCYRLDDAAQLLSLDPKALAAMVGVHSVIAVDCQQAGDDPTHKGHPGYIAYSTLKKILKAVDYGDDIIWELMECAGPHLKQSQWQTTVSARLLHRMIGRDISFAAWSSEVYNE